MRTRLRAARDFFGLAAAFAGARLRQLVIEYDIVYGEALCTILDLWYWFVLVIDSSYLSTSWRLQALLRHAPAWEWQTLFLMLALYRLTMVLFGSWPEIWIKNQVYKNPFMRTPAQMRGLFCAHWVGLLASIFFYSLLGYLLSSSGPSWGTGTFILLSLLCLRSAVKVSGFLITELLAEHVRRNRQMVHQRGAA